jgi:hypothetical protein
MKMPDGKTVTALKNPVLGKDKKKGYVKYSEYSHNNIHEQDKVFRTAGEMVKEGYDERRKQSLR